MRGARLEARATIPRRSRAERAARRGPSPCRPACRSPRRSPGRAGSARPAGRASSRVMPAISSAFVFTTAAWPSTRCEDDRAVADDGVEVPARREDGRLPLRLDPVRRRRSTASASVAARSARRRCSAATLSTPVRSKPSSRSPMLGEVGMRIGEARAARSCPRGRRRARRRARAARALRLVADIGDPLADREHGLRTSAARDCRCGSCRRAAGAPAASAARRRDARVQAAAARVHAAARP